MPIITQGDLTGLTDRHAAFVIEYLKDFSAQDAAVRIGLAPATGYEIRDREDVSRVLEHVMSKRLDVACIDATWHLQQLVENHELARQAGKLSASNQALMQVGKHAKVNSFAPEQIHVIGDEEVMRQLQRGRQRVESEGQTQPPQDNESDLTPSLDFGRPR